MLMSKHAKRTDSGYKHRAPSLKWLRTRREHDKLIQYRKSREIVTKQTPVAGTLCLRGEARDQSAAAFLTKSVRLVTFRMDCY